MSVLIWVPGPVTGSALSQNRQPQVVVRPVSGQSVCGFQRGGSPQAPAQEPPAHSGRSREAGSQIATPCECPAAVARREGLPVATCLVSGHPPPRPTAWLCLWSFPAQAIWNPWKACSLGLPVGQPVSLLISRETCSPQPPPAQLVTGQLPWPGRSHPGIWWVRFELFCWHGGRGGAAWVHSSVGMTVGIGRRGAQAAQGAWARVDSSQVRPLRQQSQLGIDLPLQIFERPWSQGELRAHDAWDPLGDPSQSRAWLDFHLRAHREPSEGPMAGL